MKDMGRYERRARKKGYHLIAGVDEVGRGCERPDAEILTNNGWKFYSDIILGKDKILSYTNDGYIRWQKIEKVIEKEFKGNLVELKNRGLNIVVTPDHYFTVIKRVSKRDKRDNNRLRLIGYKARKKREKVTDLLDNDFISRGGKWKGIDKKFLKLPKMDKNKEELVDIKLWVAFLGIFLAEGSADYDKKKGSYRIFISQNKNASPNNYEKIWNLLRKLPFRFTKFENGFRCLNKQLYTYLKQFGNRYNKFIPEDIKELPPHLINILIKWLVLSDGTCCAGKDRKKVCIYYTVSKRLKDDFEEVLLKAGWTYHTSVRKPKDSHIKSRRIKKENQVPCFKIRLRRNNKAQIKYLHKREIFYKGKVFCLRLSKYHNFYVRRNGAGYFTGNSLAGPVVACALILPPKCRIKGLDDSKRLSPKKRDELYPIIREKALSVGLGRVGERKIDEINILKATHLAMKRAISRLKVKPDLLLVDGFEIPGIGIPQKAIVRGDEKSASIAAASVVAKVTRDRLMVRYHKKHPGYDFHKHKGYGTKRHIRALRKHGSSRIHRKSFAKVGK